MTTLENIHIKPHTKTFLAKREPHESRPARDSMESISRLFCMFSVLITIGACRSGLPKSEDTAAAYQEALANNHPKDAYRLLSKQTQKDVPYDVFLNSWNENTQERDAQAKLVIADRTNETLYVTSKNHQLILVNNPIRWRVAQHGFQSQEAKSAKEAILLLNNQLQSLTLEPLFNLMSSAKRKPLLKEYNDFKEGLSESIKQNASLFPVSDAKAHYRFATERRRYKLTLLKTESQHWTIDDVHFLPSVFPFSMSGE